MLESNLGTSACCFSWGKVSGGHGTLWCATAELLEVLLSISPHPNLKMLAQCIHHRDAHTMQPP